MSENTAPTSIEEITPKMELKGVVKKTDLYGALVDVGVGRLGLLHISQLAEDHVKNVTDVVKEGDEITVWVLDVDKQKGRMNLTLLKPPAVTWNDITEKAVFSGEVVRVEKFGAFVDIGAERPGLVHVSELAQGYVGDPADVVTVGETIEVQVIGVNRRKKQIDLSVRALADAATAAALAEETEEEDDIPTAMELALRQAMENSGMDLPRRSDKRSKKRNKKRRRHEQDEIFSRTLKQHQGE